MFGIPAASVLAALMWAFGFGAIFLVVALAIADWRTTASLRAAMGASQSAPTVAQAGQEITGAPASPVRANQPPLAA